MSEGLRVRAIRRLPALYRPADGCSGRRRLFASLSERSSKERLPGFCSAPRAGRRYNRHLLRDDDLGYSRLANSPGTVFPWIGFLAAAFGGSSGLRRSYGNSDSVV
jgi:hypothetical protein